METTARQVDKKQTNKYVVLKSLINGIGKLIDISGDVNFNWYISKNLNESLFEDWIKINSDFKKSLELIDQDLSLENKERLTFIYSRDIQPSINYLTNFIFYLYNDEKKKIDYKKLKESIKNLEKVCPREPTEEQG